MRLYQVLMVALAAMVIAVPARAGECCEVKCTPLGDCADCGLLAGEGDECCIIRMTEDGEQKVIKLKGPGLLGLDDKLDAPTRLALLDENIRHIRATGQLRTDLAVKRLELEKLELAGTPDPGLVAARKKEVGALESQLKARKLDYEAAARKLLPDDVEDLYLLGLGLAGDDVLMDLTLGLPAGIGRRIIRCIKTGDDEEEDED